MDRPLQWWLIPGALIVLARVVTLGGAAADGEGPAGAAQEASQPMGQPMGEIAVLDAAGRRTGPAAVELGGAVIVSLPPALGGQRGRMTVWRRIDGRRETTPWLELRPRVRSDGTIPIAGLPTGRYDLAIEFGDGNSPARFVAADAPVPGTVSMSASQ